MTNLNQPHWVLFQMDPDAKIPQNMAYRGQSVTWNYVFYRAMSLKAAKPKLLVGITLYPGAVEPHYIRPEELHMVVLNFNDLDPAWPGGTPIEMQAPSEEEYPF
jgi:hypothetical protein